MAFLTNHDTMQPNNIFLGQIAQSVEQRTENPCVDGSIPSLATMKHSNNQLHTTSLIKWFNTTNLSSLFLVC